MEYGSESISAEVSQATSHALIGSPRKLTAGGYHEYGREEAVSPIALSARRVEQSPADPFPCRLAVVEETDVVAVLSVRIGRCSRRVLLLVLDDVCNAPIANVIGAAPLPSAQVGDFGGARRLLAARGTTHITSVGGGKMHGGLICGFWGEVHRERPAAR